MPSNSKRSVHKSNGIPKKRLLPYEGIKDSLADCVGYTPLVRLAKVGKDLECELVAKCEFMNPGGSVKDRIGLQMISDAEEKGILSAGDTIVEATSGNTGIALAWVAAAKGYGCTLTLPEKMSKEKVSVLKALGSQVIRTPTEAAHDAPESHISIAHRLVTENPTTHHFLNQYTNPSNPRAHEEQTAEEIWEQCGGKVDMIVMAAGTGGTVSGVAKKLKQKNPKLIAVGVEPHGSIFADKNAPKCSYLIEGIGYDFIPRVLDLSLIDKWVTIYDQESFAAARRIIKEEGMLVGGSSGAALVGALKAAKSLKKGQRCVVLFPDSIRNYLTNFVSDEWMIDKGLMDQAESSSEIHITKANVSAPIPFSKKRKLSEVVDGISCATGIVHYNNGDSSSSYAGQ